MASVNLGPKEPTIFQPSPIKGKIQAEQAGCMGGRYTRLAIDDLTDTKGQITTLAIRQGGWRPARDAIRGAISAKPLFVDLDISGTPNKPQIVAVKVSSLVKYLGLEETKIHEAAAKGELHSLIASQRDIQNYINKTVQTVKDNGINLKSPGGVSESEFRKVLKIACTTPISSSSATTLTLKTTSGDEFLIERGHKEEGMQGETFSLRKIIKLTGPELPFLGQGSFGVVEQVTDYLSSKQTFALKTADPNPIGVPHEELNTLKEKATKALLEEVAVLDKIHVDDAGNRKIIEGIQPPPIAVVNFSNGQKGYITKEYKCNLLEVLTKGAKAKNVHLDLKSNFNRLVDGLLHISNKNLCYTDIKPENILVKMDEKGNHVCDFGDFGGVRTMEESVTGASVTRSPGHYLSTDLFNIQEKKEDYEAAEEAHKPAALEEYKEAQKSSMVFSLGVTLFELCMGPVSTENISMFEKLRVIRTKLEDAEKEIKQDPSRSATSEETFKCFDLIKQMIQPDMHKRITLEEVQEKLKK